MQPSIRLGELLISKNIITEAQLLSALEYQKAYRVRLGEALIELGVITEDDMLEVLGAQLDMPVVTESSLRKIKVDYEVVFQMDLHTLKINKFLPLHFDKKKNLKVLCNDSYDNGMTDLCMKTYGIAPQLMLAKKSVILAGIAEAEREKARTESHKRLSEIITTSPRIYDLNAEESVPTVREVNYILLNAYRQRTSDIHLAQHESIAELIYRVDGVPHRSHTYPVNRAGPLINRMKAMCGFTSNNHRIPQDGSFQTIADGNNVDIRLSSMPSVFGESLAIRLLDRKSAENRTIDDLGFNEHNKARILSILKKTKGIFLITGANGSGKSSTLHTFISDLNRTGEKIIHVLEDPVEYRIPGIVSTQINEKAGMTFAKSLRHLVRHDTDILGVGEIRDSETAKISFDGANIGKLILSTLHTNDSVATIPRLLSLNVELYKIINSLLGATAQVLVRKLCVHCRGKGCPECNSTGFYGRTPLQEVLILSPNLKDALHNSAKEDTLREIAIKDGMIPLIEDGREKVRRGITTLEEVYRVLGERDDFSL